MKTKKALLFFSASLFVLFFLVSCGGGGSSSTPAAGDDSTPLNMLFVLDRSGSLGAAGWDAIEADINTFINDSSGGDVTAGINYFPAPSGDACLSGSYNPPQVELTSIPAAATVLTNSMATVTADAGTTPIYDALYGSLVFANSYKDLYMDQEVVVVLITDGTHTGCTARTINEISTLVLSAFNYNGVKTYAVALQGSSLSELNQVAAAGSTVQAIDLTANALPTGLADELLAIRVEESGM